MSSRHPGGGGGTRSGAQASLPPPEGLQSSPRQHVVCVPIALRMSSHESLPNKPSPQVVLGAREGGG